MLRDEMEVRSFPYTEDDSENDRIPLGGYDKIWDALTDELKSMFVRAFTKGELFDSCEWTVALENYRDKLMNHEVKDEEVYRVFPYMVKEVAKPVKRTGKVSVREAIMNSNLNSQEAMDSYNSQVPTSHAEEKKKQEAQTPSFKGSAFSSNSRPLKTDAPSEPQTSALAARVGSSDSSEKIEIFKKPVEKTIEKAEEKTQEKPKKKGFFSRFKGK